MHVVLITLFFYKRKKEKFTKTWNGTIRDGPCTILDNGVIRIHITLRFIIFRHAVINLKNSHS
jgi:hypothetical protein